MTNIKRLLNEITLLQQNKAIIIAFDGADTSGKTTFADVIYKELKNNGKNGTFDFAYIDADKEAFDTYYEMNLQLIRQGGIIVFDNMLLGGNVADLSMNDEKIYSIRQLNKKIHNDERVDVGFLPLCDGVYLVRKR
jgi:predicted O-methyltransferase YrrM